jgi:hypothetical protein
MAVLLATILPASSAQSPQQSITANLCAVVASPDRYNGKVLPVEGTLLPGVDSKTARQIDISVRKRTGQYSILIVIDCKDHAEPIDVKDMEAFAGMVKDVRGPHEQPAMFPGMQSGFAAVKIFYAYSFACVLLSSGQPKLDRVPKHESEGSPICFRDFPQLLQRLLLDKHSCCDRLLCSLHVCSPLRVIGPHKRTGLEHVFTGSASLL